VLQIALIIMIIIIIIIAGPLLWNNLPLHLHDSELTVLYMGYTLFKMLAIFLACSVLLPTADDAPGFAEDCGAD